MTTVKVKYGNTLRRLVGVNQSIDYNSLQDKIRVLFQIPNTEKLVIIYKDSQGDLVTMGNDDDVRDSLRPVGFASPSPWFDVTLVPPATSPSSPTPSFDAEGGKKSETEDVAAVLKRLREKLASSPESLKQLMQPYERIFESVTSASQLPDALEACIQKLCEQFTVAIAFGAEAVSAISRGAGAVPSPQTAGQPNSTGGTSRPTLEPVFVPISLPENVGFACVSPVRVGAPHQSESVTLSQPKIDCSLGADFINDALYAPAVHGGITCDACGTGPIMGSRWKSLKRHDYDLCSKCFEKEGDIFDYVRIDCPQFSRCPELNRMMQVPIQPPYPLAHPIPQFDWTRECDRLPSDPTDAFYSGANFSYGGGPQEKVMDAQFKGDFVTVFDGTEILPGVSFTKSCRVRNTGIYPWPVMTYLEHVGGSALGQESRILLPDVPIDGLAPEQEMLISIDLIAPNKSGLHISFWSLALESGHRFGNPLTLFIKVRKETAQNAELAASTPRPFSGQSIEVGAVLLPDEPQAAEIGGGSVSPSGGESDSEITSLEKTDLQKNALTKFDLGEEFAIVYAKDAAAEVPQEEERKEFLKTFGEVPQEGGREILKTSCASDVVEVDEGCIAYPVLDVTSDAGPVTYPTIEAIQPTLWDSVISASSASGFSNSQPEPEPKPEPSVYPTIFDNSEPTPSIVDSMYFDSVMAVPSVPVDEAVFTSKALLAKLEAMGFADSELNLELLEKNSMDLRSTLNDLCTADEWEPFLVELDEMGFHDVAVNRRLMFKNDGSVKRVVKDLVQMYRDEPSQSLKMRL